MNCSCIGKLESQISHERPQFNITHCSTTSIPHVRIWYIHLRQANRLNSLAYKALKDSENHSISSPKFISLSTLCRMAKRVCIIGNILLIFNYNWIGWSNSHIGAGPSGIAAAKTLVHDFPGHFHVTIFEKTERIGGLWPISKQDDGMVNPEMRINQSRHTVSFSDLAWPASSPVGLKCVSFVMKRQHWLRIQVFPKAWQQGQYLQRYDAKSGWDLFKFN